MLSFTNPDRCGFLPEFLDPADPRDSITQLDANYAHGGGWSDFFGMTLVGWPLVASLTYPGEAGRLETFAEVARAQMRDESIVLFESDWVAVIQPDGAHRIARMD